MSKKYIAKQPDENGIIHYTEEENETWNILIDRQWDIIKDRACDEYLQGLELINMPRDRVPQCNEISKVLNDCTGWAVQEVSAIISLNEFFNLLANKKFPAATFIRIREELDYLQEPDIFHEFYGHCPLLTNKAYADFMEWYGKTAIKADRKIQILMGRLFWFTIEFGLMKKGDEFKIYGGGILSSKEESVYSVESDIPKRIPLNIETTLRTPYRYDIIQPLYYYINSIDDLYTLMDTDLIKLAEQVQPKGDLEPSFITC